MAQEIKPITLYWLTAALYRSQSSPLTSVIRPLHSSTPPPEGRGFPPLVSVSKVGHSFPSNFVGAAPTVEPEPMPVLSRHRRAEPSSLWRIHIPCSHPTWRNVLVPRRYDALGRTVRNFNHETATPFVELNRKKIDTILNGATKVR